MKLASEHNKISLAECRKTLCKGGINYSDEELIKIRDWVDNMADIVLAVVEKNGVEEMNEIIDRAKRNETESS